MNWLPYKSTMNWFEEIPAFVHGEPKQVPFPMAVPLSSNYFGSRFGTDTAMRGASMILIEAIEGWLKNDPATSEERERD